MIDGIVDRRRCSARTLRESVIVYLRSGSVRALLFALIWWMLTDGAMDSWQVGAAMVLFSTLVSVLMLPPFFWSLTGIVAFVPFFLWHSLRGGVDVAKRAFHPKLPIAPEILKYPLQLPPGLPRVFMANIVSLLPGTLSAELGENCLHVHVLDERKDFLSELEKVEQRVAAIFCTSLLPSRASE